MTSSLDGLPIWLIAIVLLALLALAHLGGRRLLRLRKSPVEAADDSQEGLLISAVLGLLALLLGFTFALAVDRFETRRLLVLEEANAIRTAYLQAQTFGEPHRAELSRLIADYTNNRLALGAASDVRIAAPLAHDSERLRVAMWVATVRAVNSQRDDISSTFMGSMSRLIEVAAARKAEREARVPQRVFTILLIYMLVVSAGLGYISRGRHPMGVSILLVLAAMSFVLIIDIDGATGGGVRESQAPMQDLKSVAGRQPGVLAPALVPH